MAASKSKPKASQTEPLKPTKSCTTVTDHAEQGALDARNCHDRSPHLPHGWFSHIKESNVWCNGSGVPPEPITFGTEKSKGSGYSSHWKPYTPKVKKDYSTGWREDYEAALTVEEARKIAYDMHSKDTDKSGDAYWMHLEGVRMGVEVLGGNGEEQIAALFHDSVEDGHTTHDMLEKIGVNERTREIIEAVSKRSSEEQNLYLARVIKQGEGAMRVKLADLLHNTRHDRMAKVKEKKGQYVVDRLLKKYRPSIARLMLELQIIVDEDTQKKLATKPIGSAGGYSSGSSYGSGSKSMMVDLTDVLTGDWLVGTPAPVLDVLSIDEKAAKGRGEIAFLLANGQTHVEELRWSAQSQNVKGKSLYTQNTWETDKNVTFSGVSEEDIADYMSVLDEFLMVKKSNRLDGEPTDAHAVLAHEKLITGVPAEHEPGAKDADSESGTELTQEEVNDLFDKGEWDGWSGI